jgi:hypothetical protein
MDPEEKAIIKKIAKINAFRNMFGVPFLFQGRRQREGLAHSPHSLQGRGQSFRGSLTRTQEASSTRKHLHGEGEMSLHVLKFRVVVCVCVCVSGNFRGFEKPTVRPQLVLFFVRVALS